MRPKNLNFLKGECDFLCALCVGALVFFVIKEPYHRGR